jgi:hypothetical protein
MQNKKYGMMDKRNDHDIKNENPFNNLKILDILIILL